MSYSDILLVFFIGFIGTIVILIGFGSMAIKKVSEPKRELLQKVEKLEEEIQALKDKK